MYSARTASSGSKSAREMSPSARARAHDVKLRAREARRMEGTGPGPGQYDTAGSDRNGSTKATTLGGSAFKSRTPRGKATFDPLRDLSLNRELALDPGSYDPSERSSLSARAKTSFSKGNLSGRGSFGSHSARRMRLDIMGEGETPDPTSYIDAKPGLVQASNRMKSSVFHSNSAQRPMKILGQDQPAVGAYSPKDDLTTPSIQNAAASLRSKTERFKDTGFASSGSARGTSEAVGPGSHEMARHQSIAADVRKHVKRMSKAKDAGFLARLAARDLPFEKSLVETSETPGPMTYEVKPTSGRHGRDRAEGHGSVFASHSQRTYTIMPGFKSEISDPGQYEPNQTRELAAQAKTSFSKGNLSGRGSFGSHSARRMRLDIMGEGETPDPTSYIDAKPGLVQASNRMKSSVFHSNSAQRPMKILGQDQPAVGAYSPKDDLTTPSIQNAFASLRSKTDRFSGGVRLFDKTGTPASLGPGAHNVDSLSGGSRSTIASSVLSRKKEGKNASFRSESVRDLNGAFFKSEAYF